MEPCPGPPRYSTQRHPHPQTTHATTPKGTPMPVRTYLRHGPVAELLRTHPHEWRDVRTYDAQTTASTTASSIRYGVLRAYRPAGHYEAEVTPNPNGGFTVRARYIHSSAPRSAA